MKEFIRDGECLYSIVIPRNATWQCNFAAKELQTVIGKACNGAPPILTDGVDYIPQKSVHIGDTERALSQGDVKPALADVGRDGYVVAVRGETVFISAAGMEGVVYGVYEFLFQVLRVEYFAPEEWKIPQTQTAYLPNSDVEASPDIETRVRNFDWAKYDIETQYRYGFNTRNGRRWVTWAHTHFELIPKEKYWETHREFYDPTGNQLCLTAPGLLDAMEKEITSRLTPEEFEKSDVLFVMVGHEDNGTFCSCPRCTETAQKYGGKSGVMMRFINPLADRVTAFVEKNYPGKKATVVTFGYGPTIEAPVVWHEDGSCSPVDESVVARPNVGVMLAPLGSDWAHSLVDETYNEKTRRSLVGWREIKPELFVWTYDSVFDDSFIFIDNWKYLGESYNLFKEYGATYLFDQGHTGDARMQFNFEALRNFVRAKLMWNLEDSVDELVRRFMKGYYKEAADAVENYFYALRAHFEQVEKSFHEKGIVYRQPSYVRAQPFYREPEFWDKAFLEEQIGLLWERYRSLEDDGPCGAKNRLAVELLSPLYVYLELYAFDLDIESLKEYIEFFKTTSERNTMTYYAEHGPGHTLGIYKKLVAWRSVLWAKEHGIYE